MPELPEVENFRQILLPLVDTKAAAASSKSKKKGSIINNKHASSSSSLILECPPPLPTKRFPSQNVIESINQGGYVMKDVLRKGKVLCVILEKKQQNSKNASSKKKTSSKTKIIKSAKKEEVTNNNNDNDNDIGNNTPTITGHESKLYLSLHMGMTGRISSPHHVPSLESLSEDDAYPPPHTHLILRSSNGEEAAFSDPRRFGSVLLDVVVDNDDHGDGEDQDQALMVEREEVSIPTFRDIAQDALGASKAYCAAMKSTKSKGSHSDSSDTTTQQQHQQPSIVEKISNRKKGIKGLLLDQRAVISGIGNWVADEILYRSRIHPDQSYLTFTESQKLVEEMHHVLFTAVAGLKHGIGFPKEWLFHRRWRNGGGGGSGGGKDYNGRIISFVQSGGRSTAIVAALQKEDKARKAEKKAKGGVTSSSKKKGKTPKKKQVDGPSSPEPDAVTSISKSSKSKVQKRPKKAKGVGAKKSQRKREVEEPLPKLEVAISAPEESSWKIPRIKKRKRIEEESPAAPKTQPTRRSMRIMSR